MLIKGLPQKIVGLSVQMWKSKYVNKTGSNVKCVANVWHAFIKEVFMDIEVVIS